MGGLSCDDVAQVNVGRRGEVRGKVVCVVVVVIDFFKL